MRLLVVEDDSALRQQLQAALQRAGFAVDVAADGIDGEHLGAVAGAALCATAPSEAAAIKTAKAVRRRVVGVIGGFLSRHRDDRLNMLRIVPAAA